MTLIENKNLTIFARVNKVWTIWDLQVHHLEYVDGNRVWECPDDYLITLCKRCHAEKHDKIMPSSGWEYLGSDDLGDLIGECEYCHTDIRHEHYLYHPIWGELTVGAICADKLTMTEVASKIEKERKRYASRLKRFIGSTRWKSKDTKYGYILYCLKQDEYKVKIRKYDRCCKVTISFFHTPSDCLLTGRWIDLNSKKEYKTLDDAKAKVFEVIESGELERYINEKYLPELYGLNHGAFDNL